jgi:hypothetical protein
MKLLRYILPTLLLTLLMACPAEAKRISRPVYMFGFSASFKDSVVYITDVQNVQNAWLESKTNHLLGRESYSGQLKDYLTDKLQLQTRICLVFFGTSKGQAEKKLQKIKKRYTEKAKGSFDVRYITATDFRFEPVDMSQAPE